VKKPIFTKVLQVAVVVPDCDAAVKKYADEYGIGPWQIMEFNPETVKDMIIRDERVDYAMRLAVCDIGGVQWEIIEPKDDKSIYAEFLKKHGPGLHHVAFGTDDYDETMRFAREKGLIVLQAGTWGGLTYTYLSTQDDLGVIAEIYSGTADDSAPPPDAVYPEE
jgi:methylmalonyl-CoA/ethylmalonyl-CoA epimerase